VLHSLHLNCTHKLSRSLVKLHSHITLFSTW
jgi:hypothetical protein